MTLDSVGLNFIASHELGPTGNQAGTFVATPAGPSGGFAAKPYNDPAGNAIIGYGHLLHPGEVDATDVANYPNPIGQATATRFFTQDTVSAVNAVNNDVTVPLAQDQFDALVDFTYNEGTGTFAKSTLLEDVDGYKFTRCRASLISGFTAQSMGALRLFLVWSIGGMTSPSFLKGTSATTAQVLVRSPASRPVTPGILLGVSTIAIVLLAAAQQALVEEPET